MVQGAWKVFAIVLASVLVTVHPVVAQDQTAEQKQALTDEEKWYDLTVQYALAFRQEKYQEAMGLAKKALVIAQTAFESPDARTAQLLNDMGKLENAQEHHKSALKYHKRALELREQIFPENTPPIVQSKTNLAKTYFGLRNYRKADSILKEMIPLIKTQLGDYHGHVGTLLTLHGEVLWQQERYEEARDAFMEAVNVLQRHTVDGKPLIKAMELYGQALKRLGYTEESVQVQVQVNTMKQSNPAQLE